MTSIAWREAWKYRSRAYRYCLHDMGHAWQARELAARSMGCDSFAAGQFVDDQVAGLCRLSEDEWPMLLVELRGDGIPVMDSEGPAATAVWFEGKPNHLSADPISYTLIDEMHGAAKLRSFPSRSAAVPSAAAEPEGSGDIHLPPPATAVRAFGEVARTRRSALDFVGGGAGITLEQLSALLAPTAQPFSGDFAAERFIQLYLYAHRVDGLAPGVYRYWPRSAQLELIRAGDQRVAAAGLSLGQDLAGNACVAFSMIGDLERAARSYGDRGYRYVYFEAGAIGQRLYLAAETLGLRATGIGAFFDDEVHRYLGVKAERGQVVYHFAIGYPVEDRRLDAW